MIVLFYSSLVISAIALLWRIFSREEFIVPRIEALPYLIRKPLTCGVCFSFWISLIFTILFKPDFGTDVVLNQIPSGYIYFAKFFADWFLLGMVSVGVLYTFLTFWEGSHYLSHKADELHDKNPKT